MAGSVREILRAARQNRYSDWNFSGTSTAPTDDPDAACNRIHSGLARVHFEFKGKPQTRESRIFTMGSCFAREIENRFERFGGHVVSMDDALIDHDAFRDENGSARAGVFNRYTPYAMLHEFRMAFGELEGWDPASSLVVPARNGYEDLNYHTVMWKGGSSLEHVLYRREVGAALTRRAAEADLIVLTLGFIECWKQLSTGYDVNRFSKFALQNAPEDYAFHVMEVEEVEQVLEDVRNLILRHHKTGNFQLIITVSPVPLGKTFTTDDIVVANTNSKSTLRTAAGRFCRTHDNVHYFPSYEIVTHSRQDLAWRPDKLHVMPDMGEHVVRTFINAVFEPDAFPLARAADSKAATETEVA